MDFEEGVIYRMAFGLARRIAEAQRFDMQHTHFRTNPAAGGAVEIILAEVLRRVRPEGDDGRETELVRRGVEDALAGRRPQW